MNENIQLKMNPSVKKQRSIGTSIALFSQDVDNYSFDITFTDLELQAGDEVEVLAKLQGGKLEHKSSATLVEVDGELIARYVFDTKLIDSEGHVFCYVYLKRGDKSADVGAFYFEVDLSELDKVGGKIAEVYDGRYEDLVAGFEIRLQEYRDSLPQASEVRAEIDVILNQFGMDSQAKLNQYDDDAQQAIADWEQGADALLDTVEGNESVRVDAEATRETAETDRVSSEATRKTNETTRISNEDERNSAESVRVANEEDRISKDSERDSKIEALGEQVKFPITNLTTNGDFRDGVDGWAPAGGTLEIQEGGLVFTITSPAWNNLIRLSSRVNVPIGKYYWRVVANTPTGSIDLRINNVSNAQSGEFGTFDVYSNVVNVDSDTSAYSPIYISGAELAVNTQIIFKNVLTINLTATFGAGNEPTKSEMDELIKITGYFDEITLTQMQMLKWQLKLMRQNRNALIALGGTII